MRHGTDRETKQVTVQFSVGHAWRGKYGTQGIIGVLGYRTLIINAEVVHVKCTQQPTLYAVGCAPAV